MGGRERKREREKEREREPKHMSDRTSDKSVRKSRSPAGWQKGRLYIHRRGTHSFIRLKGLLNWTYSYSLFSSHFFIFYFDGLACINACTYSTYACRQTNWTSLHYMTKIERKRERVADYAKLAVSVRPSLLSPDLIRQTCSQDETAILDSPFQQSRT